MDASPRKEKVAPPLGDRQS